MDALPAALGETGKVCGFFSLASSKAGINMRAVAKIGAIIRELALNSDQAIGAAKFVVFANPVSDNPFMAGGFRGLQFRGNTGQQQANQGHRSGRKHPALHPP